MAQKLKIFPLKTPLNVVVLTHKWERPQKSTVSSVQEIISNSENRRWDIKQPMESQVDASRKSLVLYPHKDALHISQVPNLEAYEQLVVVDGPWRRVPHMAKQLVDLGFQPVVIHDRETRFWRHQQLSKIILFLWCGRFAFIRFPYLVGT
jgi:DTW domain-containing protein YfiP